MTATLNLLETLIADLGYSKAILIKEATEKYGDVTVNIGLKKKYFASVETPLGQALALAHKGRKQIGLTGAYRPTINAVCNALALRQVSEALRAQGYAVEPRNRSTVWASRPTDTFIALVRFTGYDHATVRRMCDRLIGEGETSELRVYVGAEKVEKLSQMVWPKTAARPHVTPDKLKILALLMRPVA
jgi:hypothetical protein